MADRTMFRGDSYIFTVQVLQPPPGSPPGTPPQPANIAGWTAWFTMKNTYVEADSQAVVQLTTTPPNGVLITDAVRGYVQVTVPPSATRTLPDGPVTLVYDVQVMDLSSNIFTIEAGTILVSPDVTRAVS